jgi:hypothetical protein
MRNRFSVSLLVAFLIILRALAQDSPTTSSSAPNPITLRVAGSFVLDAAGDMAGNVESVVVEPRSSQVLFAMVSTEYPSNRLMVTPMPWQLLHHRSDARYSSGLPGTYQQFQTPIDRLTILRAPKVRSEQGTNDAAWMQASYQYFQAAVGAPGTASGTQTGGASATAADPAGFPSAAATSDGTSYVPFFSGGSVGGVPVSPAEEFLLLGTSLFGPAFLTNAFATNIAGTNLALATNLFTTVSNFFATTVLSNVVAGSAFATNLFGTNRPPTNFFAGTFTNTFGTNVFGTNLASLRTNFFARFGTNPPTLGPNDFVVGGLTNPVRIAPGTNKILLNAPAGAPGADSGRFTPENPQRPIPPTQPVQQPAPPARVRPAPAPVPR